tara:strand:+ start:165 stop:311 length:147 start_codon:yes stop_codon:yes gene_type:complete
MGSINFGYNIEERKKNKKKNKKKKFISLPKKVGKTNKINDRNEKKRPN